MKAGRKLAACFLVTVLMGVLSVTTVLAAKSTEKDVEAMVGDPQGGCAYAEETASEQMEILEAEEVEKVTGASTGSCGSDITYKWDTDGSLTLTGTGAMTDYDSCTDTPWFSWRTNVTEIIISEGITHIGKYAFGMIGATSVSLPESLVSIGDYAFWDSSITSLELPSSVSSLGDGIFQECEALTAITVASGNDSFAAADGILFNKGKTEILAYPAGKTTSSYTVPGTVKTIAAACFAYNSYLTSLTIPDSVTTAGEDFATHCSALQSVSIGKGLEVIPNCAFMYDSALTSVTLSKGLKEIHRFAFSYCTALTKLTVPSTVTWVEEYAFSYSENVEVTYPSSLVESGGAYYAEDTVDLVKVTGKSMYSYAYQVLDLVNKERAAQGLSALTMDMDLLEASMRRAAECVVYYGHTRPSGCTFDTISWKAGGENIAIGYYSPTQVMTAWMNSDGHRENILYSGWTTIGVGCFVQNGVITWVQNFGSGDAKTGSQPSDVTETCRVVLDGDHFNSYLSLSASASTLKTGKSLTISASLINEGFPSATASLDASGFVWKSSKSSVAAVNSSGKVTAKKPGSVTITAKTGGGGMSASLNFTVSLATPSISKVTNTSSGVKVTWKKVTGASGYYVYRRTGTSGSYKKIATVKSGSTVSYINKTSGTNKVTAGTTYYYKIVAYYGSKKSSKSSASSICYLAAGKLSSVKNTASKKMTVKWSKRSGVTGYQIQYSTKSDFSSSVKKVKVKGASSTSQVISSLTKGKTYYVRIRTYKTESGNTYYSAWSGKKKVKISK